MKIPFRAYSGDEPYVFVSYAHDDANTVYPEMQWLHDQGFNVWYDEGISPGAVWRNELAESIMGAGLFLFFVTPRSVKSDNCEKEVDFAIDHGIPVLTVHLQQTELPSGMKLTLSNIQGIMKYDLPDQAYREKLLASVGDYLERGISASPPVKSNQYRKVMIAAGAIVAILFAAYASMNTPKTIPRTDESSNDIPVRRFTVELPRSMRIDDNFFRPVTISADGQRLIFNARVERQDSLYSRPLDSLDVLKIKGTENATRQFALSPDNEWIAYQDGRDRMLKKIPAGGGIPVTLCDPGGVVLKISWGANDSIVFVNAEFAGLMQVSSAGGEPQQLTNPPDGEFHKQVEYSRDGRAVFFTVGERGVTMRRADRIAVLSLDTGEQKTLMAGASPRATSTGHLIYFSENALRAVAFDAERLEVKSESVAVADGVLYNVDAHYSISDDGTLVYVLATDLVRRSLVWVDRFGNEEEVSIDKRPYMVPRVSPNGDQLAFVIDAENGADLWAYSLDRGTSTRLTFDESREASPVWSPDGRHVVFSSNRVDDLFRVAIDGTGPIEQLTDTSAYQFAHSFSPSGDSVFLHEGARQARGDTAIRVLSFSDKSISTVLATSFSSIYPQISPDGRWLAYTSNRSGHPELYVRPYPDVDSAVWQVSVDGGFHALWSEDSDELIYWGLSEMMSAKIDTEGGFRAARPEPLFSHDPYFFSGSRSFDLDRTNDRFLMVKKPSEDEIPTNRIIIVQNWIDEVAIN
jgi:serine/threonine-protein kinase